MSSGAMRKKRGVKPGVPDVLVWYRGKSIAIELKSLLGQCSPSQRAVRERLRRTLCWAGTANSAMVALRKSGVPFRATRTSGGRGAPEWGLRSPRRRLPSQ